MQKSLPVNLNTSSRGIMAIQKMPLHVVILKSQMFKYLHILPTEQENDKAFYLPDTCDPHFFRFFVGLRDNNKLDRPQQLIYCTNCMFCLFVQKQPFGGNYQ